MTLMTSLPREVLSMVFNKLNDLNSLIECRIACKAWSVPAEKAMLNTIAISSNAAKTRSLCAVLKKNPEKAYLIKHLNFNDTNPSPEIFIPELLQLALASNIESITGIIWAAGFMDALKDIIERSPNKLKRLKNLALDSFECEAPLRLALHCRNTIQTLVLDFTAPSFGIDWNFVNRLNQFTKLTSLELTAEFGAIIILDRILSKCQQLQKLTLSTLNWEPALDWDQQRTERNTNLSMLSISKGECPIEMLDYLLYKYPNINYTSANIVIDDGSNQEYITQVSRLLQRVPQRELIHCGSEDADYRSILVCLINNGCKITIEKLCIFNQICFKVDY